VEVGGGVDRWRAVAEARRIAEMWCRVEMWSTSLETGK
jgi:hypothetical protein